MHAVTLQEKWFSIFVMLVGIALFFGFILGGMASMLTNLDSQRARYIHHLDVIKDHMVCYIITGGVEYGRWNLSIFTTRQLSANHFSTFSIKFAQISDEIGSGVSTRLRQMWPGFDSGPVPYVGGVCC